MTYYETVAEVQFGIRLKLAGVLVHSVDLPYTESDGYTAAQTDINSHPYIANVQADGHSITIRVEGTNQVPEGSAFARKYTITADAPFWSAYTCQLGQVLYEVGTHPDADYLVGSDLRSSPTRFALGNTTASCDLVNDLTTLWNTCTISGKYNFGGIITANIDWCTYKPLRNRNNGILLRDPTTGKILVDC